MKVCVMCNGRGEYDVELPANQGNHTTEVCPECHGTGKNPPAKRCASCLFWTKRVGPNWYRDGICKGLQNDDMVEIELRTGWDGGYVNEIYTMENFLCKNYRKRK